MSKNSKVKRSIFAALLLCILAATVWKGASAFKAEETPAFDWRKDWAVPEGFSLSLDTEGYQFPTAVAFVPQPGKGPKDPLYFVTELRGRVKVVTNDRSVYSFTEDFFQLQPEKELPEAEGESGLAGLCLAPEKGYVFVTFAYQDEDGSLRNNVMRFESKPQTFSLKPTGQLAFTELFAGYETAISHQIGSCQVAGDALFVSVGDGRQTEQSQEVNSLLGKVLRMTLDGEPVADNPFYQPEDGLTAADYVWAYGFRNPFGLKAVGERIFVADNGSDLDRIVELRAGENYFWNGNDWSIGARADVALSPDVAPVQLEYNLASSKILPDPYGQSFFIAASKPEMAGVLRVGYSLDGNSATGVPDYFIRYQGESMQIVVGAALGPDGLYFVPILPDADGRSAVFKVAYNPGHQHPYLISHLMDPEALMWAKGCYGCHQLGDEGGTAGPPLDQRLLVGRLEKMLASEEYSLASAEIDRLEREPFTSFRGARAEVAAADGDEKLRLWMIYHIMEPRFDNPQSRMPNLGLTRTEATIITDYLLQERSFTERTKDFILQYLPAVPMPRHLLFAFVLGLVTGSLLLFLGFIFTRRVRH